MQELAADLETEIIGVLPRSQTVLEAETLGKTVLEAFPDSEMAQVYRKLADQLLQKCGGIA